MKEKKYPPRDLARNGAEPFEPITEKKTPGSDQKGTKPADTSLKKEPRVPKCWQDDLLRARRGY